MDLYGVECVWYGVESGVESFKGYLTMYYILIPDKNSVENFKCCYFPCMWANCKQRIRPDLTGSNLIFH